MQKIKKILVAGLLLAMFLAEIARIPLGNGIAVTLVDVVSGLIFITVVLNNLKRKNIVSDPLFKPLKYFLIFCLLSLGINLFWLSTIQAFSSFLYIVRFAFLASVYFFVKDLDKKEQSSLPFYMTFIGVAIVLVGLVQYFYIDFISLSFLDWDIHWFRLFSTFIDPNFMGIFLALSFFLSLTLLINAVTQKNKLKIGFLIFSCLALLSGLLLTFSRSALISLVFGLVVFGFLYKKARKIVLIMTILFAIGIGIILINYQATEGTKLFRLNSSKARLTSITSALTVIKDHPLFGVGFNTYRYAMHKYGFAVGPNWQYSHSDAGTDNSFLFVLATTGVFGFISFIYLFYKIVRGLLKNIEKDPMKILGITSMCVLSVGSLFVNAFFYPLILIWIWVILGLTEI